MSEAREDLARARAQGEADARAGVAMSMKFWHMPDEIKDAYRDGYVKVGRPRGGSLEREAPSGRRRNGSQPKPPPSSLRVWRDRK